MGSIILTVRFIDFMSCHSSVFIHLNAKSNPIYHLLALLGAHHILHVSRIGVNNHMKIVRWYMQIIIMGFYIQKWNAHINNITIAIYVYICMSVCVTKCLFNKACDSEFDYPWPNICDSDITENLSSVAILNEYEISWNEKWDSDHRHDW